MEVKLHDIGEGMTEADISCFLVKPGDRVKADDPLVEVITDKMTAEIPAPAGGIVKEFKVEPGSTVRVGTTLLILDTGSESPGMSEQNFSMKGVYDRRPSGRILASPYTRKIARDNAIRLEDVTGSGLGGRITDEDVYLFIEKFSSAKPGHHDGAPRDPLIAGNRENASKNSDADQQQTISDRSAVRTLPFRGRRKQIGRKMMQSLQTIPHCTHFEEVDVTELIEFRKSLKERAVDVSATAFFIKILSVCLKEFPIFNAKLDEEKEEILLLHEHHLGVAVDTEEGLIVPVIRNVEKKSLQMIHQELRFLTDKALQNELTSKDISGGTFTISNVGPLGGSIGATPIIQHPQVALVSFHKTKRMPVVNDAEEIVIRSIMNISMSFDHRVVDGANAVRFTNRFSHFISNPKSLLLELI